MVHLLLVLLSLGQVEISVKVYLFDMMMLNDKSLIKLPLRHRTQLLQLCFTPIVNRLDFVCSHQFAANGLDEHDPEELKAVLLQAVEMKSDARLNHCVITFLAVVLV
jgi:ATP-dependent DNA ligase